MRALVTGGTGFVGGHLLRHLQAAGWEVGALMRGVPRLPEGVMAYGYAGGTDEVMTAVREWRPDAVFHLATLFVAAHKAEQVEGLVTANVLYGTQVLEAMRAAGVTALVNAGTGWQHYAEMAPWDEAAYRPANLYAATKQAFETIATYYVETAGLRMVSLRLFDSYGPGDERGKLLGLMINALHTGELLGMSPGDQVLDLVHVDDLCGAFVHAAGLALAMQEPGQVAYAVSGGERRTLREVAATLGAAAGREVPVRFGVRSHRGREVMHPWQGPELPGWEARVKLLEGLRELVVAEGLG